MNLRVILTVVAIIFGATLGLWRFETSPIKKTPQPDLLESIRSQRLSIISREGKRKIEWGMGDGG